MRILDLFCGAGGAAMGYHRAFPDAEIVGIDIEPQPRYPFTKVLGDANNIFEMIWPRLRDFDLIHASPPCQDYSSLRTSHGGHGTAWMLPLMLGRLRTCGLPWVVENVAGSEAEMGNFITLCGSSFGLGVRRHRNFATSFPLMAPPCAHYLQPEPVDVTGTGGPTPDRVRVGGGVSRKPRNLDHAREVMGIDWMNRRELSQAIPPAYTEWIGNQFKALVKA